MNAHTHSDQCSSLLGNLSDFIDGQLRADLCSKIEEHMKTCENCRIVVNTLKKTVELYEKNSESAEIPIDVKERLFARLEITDYLTRIS